MKKYLNLFFFGIVLLLSILIIINNKRATVGKQNLQAADTVRLWDGKSFNDWDFVLADSSLSPDDVWKISDGVIRCRGDFGYMQTKEIYSSYRLHVEWRWPENPGNSGVFLHISGKGDPFPPCIECQLLHNSAGDFIAIGGTDFNERVDKTNLIVSKLNPSSELPAGEWNCYDITVKQDTITVKVNGVLQNTATGTSVTSGKIGLQSEGAPIEFRSVYLLRD